MAADALLWHARRRPSHPGDAHADEWKLAYLSTGDDGRSRGRYADREETAEFWLRLLRGSSGEGLYGAHWLASGRFPKAGSDVLKADFDPGAAVPADRGQISARRLRM